MESQNQILSASSCSEQQSPQRFIHCKFSNHASMYGTISLMTITTLKIRKPPMKRGEMVPSRVYELCLRVRYVAIVSPHLGTFRSATSFRPSSYGLTS